MTILDRERVLFLLFISYEITSLFLLDFVLERERLVFIPILNSQSTVI
jgi:hypothetical protein